MCLVKDQFYLERNPLQRDKFLYSCGVSLNNNDVLSLCEQLSMLATKPQDNNVVFIVFAQSDKNKCLVLKTDLQYGSLTLVQKNVEKIPDSKPKLNSDAEIIAFEEERPGCDELSCHEDEQYNSFS